MNRFIQKALCAVAACALTLSLSACGSTSPATGAASAGIPTVTIWGYGGQEVREALQAVADAHNADPAYNTKARVEIQFVVSGTSEQSLPDRLAAAYQAGETDTDFDIIALDDSGISAILAQTSEDFFIPIDTSKIPNYENVEFKDNIVGDTFIPYRGTAVMLAYNSETVENPPATADELYQWIKDNPGRFAYCDPSTGGSGYTFVTTAIYNQLPDEARMSPDTKWETEHTAEWDNAFALMAELHPYLYQTAGKVQYPMKNAVAGPAGHKADRHDARVREHGAQPEEYGYDARVHQAPAHRARLFRCAGRLLHPENRQGSGGRALRHRLLPEL